MTPDTAALRAQIRANEDAAAFYGGTPNRIILDPDTVRALCDATDEVERLRGDRDALREQVQRLRASRESNRGGWARTLVERDALRAAVDRVRALGERDGRDRLTAWFASNGVDQPATVAVEAAAFVLAALESGNYGTPEWFSSIEKPLFGRAADAEGLAGVTVIRCPECDAGEPCQMVRESSAIARPETGDGAEDAPCPMRDEPAPSSDDPHGACSRNLVAVAVERDKARAALSAASEHHQDDLRRLLDCREVVRSLTDERDAARASLAALVADLWVARQWLDVATDSLTDSGDGTYVAVSESLAQVRAMLDRHAGAGS